MAKRYKFNLLMNFFFGVFACITGCYAMQCPNDVIWNLCIFILNEMEIYAIVIWNRMYTHMHVLSIFASLKIPHDSCAK